MYALWASEKEVRTQYNCRVSIALIYSVFCDCTLTHCIWHAISEHLLREAILWGYKEKSILRGCTILCRFTRLFSCPFYKSLSVYICIGGCQKSTLVTSLPTHQATYASGSLNRGSSFSCAAIEMAALPMAWNIILRTTCGSRSSSV